MSLINFKFISRLINPTPVNAAIADGDRIDEAINKLQGQINAGSGGPGGSSTNSGEATLDFGSAPGTNVVTVNVTGQSAITQTSSINIFIMGTDSTATHNSFEHSIVNLNLSAIQITNGVGFTIQASSELRLTGTFKVRWNWN